MQKKGRLDVTREIESVTGTENVIANVNVTDVIAIVIIKAIAIVNDRARRTATPIGRAIVTALDPARGIAAIDNTTTFSTLF